MPARLRRPLRLAAALLAAAVLALAGLVAAGLLVPGEGGLYCPVAGVPPGSHCQVVGGRVLYVQRVDPDGDGDLHVALLSRDSVSYPGVTILKFSGGRRPARGPRLGAWITAVGYPYAGTRGEDNLRVLDYER